MFEGMALIGKAGTCYIHSGDNLFRYKYNPPATIRIRLPVNFKQRSRFFIVFILVLRIIRL